MKDQEEKKDIIEVPEVKKDGPNKKISDEEIEEALILTGGQPTKVAELLGVDYVTVWRRIRQNTDLLDVQKAYRGKTFNDMSNLSTVVAMAGIIKEPKVDPETGEVIKGEFIEKKVDYRTRLGLIQNMMSMLKADEGIKDHLVIENDGVDLTKVSDETLADLQKAMQSEIE